MFQNRKKYYSFWDRKNFEFCVCRVKDLCDIRMYDGKEIALTVVPDPRLDEIENTKMSGFPYTDDMVPRYQALGRISYEEFKKLRSGGVRRL